MQLHLQQMHNCLLFSMHRWFNRSIQLCLFPQLDLYAVGFPQMKICDVGRCMGKQGDIQPLTEAQLLGPTSESECERRDPSTREPEDLNSRTLNPRPRQKTETLKQKA